MPQKAQDEKQPASSQKISKAAYTNRTEQNSKKHSVYQNDIQIRTNMQNVQEMEMLMNYDQAQNQLENSERQYYKEINEICSPSGVKQVVHKNKNNQVYMLKRSGQALDLSEIKDYKFILNDEEQKHVEKGAMTQRCQSGEMSHRNLYQPVSSYHIRNKLAYQQQQKLHSNNFHTSRRSSGGGTNNNQALEKSRRGGAGKGASLSLKRVPPGHSRRNKYSQSKDENQTGNSSSIDSSNPAFLNSGSLDIRDILVNHMGGAASVGVKQNNQQNRNYFNFPQQYHHQKPFQQYNPNNYNVLRNYQRHHQQNQAIISPEVNFNICHKDIDLLNGRRLFRESQSFTDGFPIDSNAQSNNNMQKIHYPYSSNKQQHYNPHHQTNESSMSNYIIHQQQQQQQKHPRFHYPSVLNYNNNLPLIDDISGTNSSSIPPTVPASRQASSSNNQSSNLRNAQPFSSNQTQRGGMMSSIGVRRHIRKSSLITTPAIYNINSARSARGSSHPSQDSAMANYQHRLNQFQNHQIPLNSYRGSEERQQFNFTPLHQSAITATTGNIHQYNQHRQQQQQQHYDSMINSITPNKIIRQPFSKQNQTVIENDLQMNVNNRVLKISDFLSLARCQKCNHTQLSLITSSTQNKLSPTFVQKIRALIPAVSEFQAPNVSASDVTTASQTAVKQKQKSQEDEKQQQMASSIIHVNQGDQNQVVDDGNDNTRQNKNSTGEFKSLVCGVKNAKSNSFFSPKRSGRRVNPYDEQQFDDTGDMQALEDIKDYFMDDGYLTQQLDSNKKSDKLSSDQKATHSQVNQQTPLDTGQFRQYTTQIMDDLVDSFYKLSDTLGNSNAAGLLQQQGSQHSLQQPSVIENMLPYCQSSSNRSHRRVMSSSILSSVMSPKQSQHSQKNSLSHFASTPQQRENISNKNRKSSHSTIQENPYKNVTPAQQQNSSYTSNNSSSTNNRRYQMKLGEKSSQQQDEEQLSSGLDHKQQQSKQQFNIEVNLQLQNNQAQQSQHNTSKRSIMANLFVGNQNNNNNSNSNSSQNSNRRQSRSNRVHQTDMSLVLFGGPAQDSILLNQQQQHATNNQQNASSIQRNSVLHLPPRPGSSTSNFNTINSSISKVNPQTKQQIKYQSNKVVNKNAVSSMNPFDSQQSSIIAVNKQDKFYLEQQIVARSSFSKFPNQQPDQQSPPLIGYQENNIQQQQQQTQVKTRRSQSMQFQYSQNYRAHPHLIQQIQQEQEETQSRKNGAPPPIPYQKINPNKKSVLTPKQSKKLKKSSSSSESSSFPNPQNVQTARFIQLNEGAQQQQFVTQRREQMQQNSSSVAGCLSTTMKKQTELNFEQQMIQMNEMDIFCQQISEIAHRQNDTPFLNDIDQMEGQNYLKNPIAPNQQQKYLSTKTNFTRKRNATEISQFSVQDDEQKLNISENNKSYESSPQGGLPAPRGIQEKKNQTNFRRQLNPAISARQDLSFEKQSCQELPHDQIPSTSNSTQQQKQMVQLQVKKDFSETAAEGFNKKIQFRRMEKKINDQEIKHNKPPSMATSSKGKNLLEEYQTSARRAQSGFDMNRVDSVSLYSSIDLANYIYQKNSGRKFIGKRLKVNLISTGGQMSSRQNSTNSVRSNSKQSQLNKLFSKSQIESNISSSKILNPVKNVNNNTVHYIEKPAPPPKPKPTQYQNFKTVGSNSPQKLKIAKSSIKTQRNNIKLHFTDILNKKGGFKAPSPPANNSSRRHFKHSNVSFKGTAVFGQDLKQKSVKDAKSFTKNLLSNTENSVNSRSNLQSAQNFSLETDRKVLGDRLIDQKGGEQTARAGSQLTGSGNQQSSLIKAKLNNTINNLLGAPAAITSVQRKSDKMSSISTGGTLKKKLSMQDSGSNQIRKMLAGGNKSLRNANSSSQKKSNIIAGRFGGIYSQNYVGETNLASTSRGTKSAFTPNDFVKKQLFSRDYNFIGATAADRERSLENGRSSKKLLSNKNDLWRKDSQEYE